VNTSPLQQEVVIFSQMQRPSSDPARLATRARQRFSKLVRIGVVSGCPVIHLLLMPSRPGHQQMPRMQDTDFAVDLRPETQCASPSRIIRKSSECGRQRLFRAAE